MPEGAKTPSFFNIKASGSIFLLKLGDLAPLVTIWRLGVFFWRLGGL
jgi:hypothetical protein